MVGLTSPTILFTSSSELERTHAIKLDQRKCSLPPRCCNNNTESKFTLIWSILPRKDVTNWSQRDTKTSPTSFKSPEHITLQINWKRSAGHYSADPVMGKENYFLSPSTPLRRPDIGSSPVSDLTPTLISSSAALAVSLDASTL